MTEQLQVSKLTRHKLQATPQWDGFLQSEWKQLSWYHKVGMFGDPVPAQEDMTILPWVWTYIEKENPLTGIVEPKSRGTCNGGKQYGKAVTLAETYAACVEQLNKGSTDSHGHWLLHSILLSVLDMTLAMHLLKPQHHSPLFT